MRARRLRIGSLGAKSLGDWAGGRRAGWTWRTDSMRRRLGVATGVGAVLVGGYVGGLKLLGAMVDAPTIASDVADRASSALNRPVDVGGAAVYLLPRPGLRLSSVRIENPDGYDGPAIAAVDAVNLDISPFALARGRIEVRRIRLDGPRINLGIDERGVSNFGDLVPEGDGWAGGRVVFAPREILASEASLAVFDARATRSIVVAGAEVVGRMRSSAPADEEGAWTMGVAMTSDSLHAMVGADQIVRSGGPSATLTVLAHGSGRWLEIRDALVEHLGERLSMVGRIADLDGSTPSLALDIAGEAIPADVMTPLLPAALRSGRNARMDGTVSVDLRVRARAGAGGDPVVGGEIMLSNVGVKLPGGDALAERVDGVVSVTSDAVSFDSVIGVFSGGPFELSGSVSRPSQELAITLKGYPDIDTLDRLGLAPRGTTLSGDLAVDLSITGSLRAPEGVSAAGSATFEGLQAKHPRFGVPLYIPLGSVSLQGRSASWSELTVLLGEDRLTTSGNVHDLLAAWPDLSPDTRLEVIVHGPHVDLDEILPQRRDPPPYTYGHAAFAHLGDRSVAGRPPAAAVAQLGLSRPRALPLQGSIDIAVDTLVYRRYRLTSLTAELGFSTQELTVVDAAFGIWNGQGEGALRLGIGTEDDQPYELTARLADVDAESFLASMTPLGRTVRGSLDLDLEVSGTIDASLLPHPEETTGHGRMAIDDGRVAETGLNMAIADFLDADDWRSVSFTTWTSDFEVGQGALYIQRSDLASESGRASLSGVVGLDGSLDVAVALAIPAQRLESLSLRRTGIGQSVLDELRAAGKPLDLGVRVSGSLEAAVVEPDAGVAGASTGR